MRILLRGIPCLFLLLLVLVASPAWSEQHTIVITDDLQLGLADSFLAEGEYYRAITEYKKFLYFFPDSLERDYVQLQIGMAYYRGNECQQAIEAFAKVRRSDNSKYFTAASFYEGVCRNRLNNPAAAIDDFERVLAHDPAAPEGEEALVGMALAALDRQDWVGCRQAMKRLNDEYPNSSQAMVAEAALPLLDEAENRPRNSPMLAGTFSAIIPGSGYAYNHRYRDGLMALIVNGLFIAGTAVAIDHDNYPAAALIGGAGLPFYLGNIFGSAAAAEKWNLSISQELRSDLAVRFNYRY